MEDIARYIDHTILKPEAGEETIRRYCAEARRYGFCSVCVNSCHTALVHRELAGSGVKTCTVVGFPLGAMSEAAKTFETRQAVADGADEIDMVINIGALKDGDDERVLSDIRAVVEAAKPSIVKVIIETCLLSEEEKIRACRLSVEAGAAFVKTSTGFSSGGATAEDIRLMRRAVGDKAFIKASGGIRTPEFARELIEAGADRIGASNGIALL